MIEGLEQWLEGVDFWRRCCGVEVRPIEATAPLAFFGFTISR